MEPESGNGNNARGIQPVNKLQAIEKYQIVLLGWDILCNLIIDSMSNNPLAVLVLFVLQCIPLIVNLVLCGVSAASHALQFGIHRKSTIHLHEFNLITIISYIILTFWWYIWTLRRLWPSVGDQFSFNTGSYVEDTFSDKNNSSTNLVVNKFSSDLREHYTLWSTGFIALYTIQRTVATIYYIVYFKSIYILLNEASELSAAAAFSSPSDNESPTSLSAQRGRHSSLQTISESIHNDNKTDQQPFYYERITKSQQQFLKTQGTKSTNQYSPPGSPLSTYKYSARTNSPPNNVMTQISPAKSQHPSHIQQRLGFEDDNDDNGHDSSRRSSPKSIDSQRNYYAHKERNKRRNSLSHSQDSSPISITPATRK